jgi:hypothetical protein
MSTKEEVAESQRRSDLVRSVNKLITVKGRWEWRVHADNYRGFPLRFRGHLGHHDIQVNLKRLSQLMGAAVNGAGQGWTVHHWDYHPSVFVNSVEGDKEIIVSRDGRFTLIGYESADHVYNTLVHLECLLQRCLLTVDPSFQHL